MDALRYLEICVYLLHVSFASINSQKNYRVLPLESRQVCTLHFGFPPDIEVGKDEQSGVIVEEVVFFDTLSGKFSFDCKFKLKTIHNGMGLFAVIQKMRLRKNLTTGECVDYVQFRHSHTYTWGPLEVELEEEPAADWGEKYCGSINAKEMNFSVLIPPDQSRVLPYAYIEHEGKMDVRIHVANGSNFQGKDLELKMAFTSFSTCSQNGNKTYKKCGEGTCIFHKYSNDGILNCPFTTCLDENGCQVFFGLETGVRPSTGLATRVMVGAVAGVFTMFVVFVVFLWLFRHCSCCNAVSNVQSTTQMRPVPTVEDLQPTAPSRTPSIDKDLPPSYESLFPNTS